MTNNAIPTESKHPWFGAGLFFVALTFVMGVVYTIVELQSDANDRDQIFVGILMANTYVIYKFTAFFKQYLSRSALEYENALRQSSLQFDQTVFMKQVFAPLRSVSAGIVYGAIFFIGVMVLQPWGSFTDLNLMLACLLFVANVVTGMALFSLVIYFKHSYEIGSRLTIKLWDRSGEGVRILLDTNRYVVVATCFCASLSMISLLFSVFNFDTPIIFFSVVCVLIILLAYLIPVIPITRQIRHKKRQSLSELRELMEVEYQTLMTSGYSDEKMDSSRFDTMADLYKSVESVRAYPPVGHYSLKTVASVTVLTILPTAIDFIKDMWGCFQLESSALAECLASRII